MTDDEARKFGEWCVDAWPNGPKAYIWREFVKAWDFGPARAAFRRLLNEAQKTPTTGQLRAHYDNITPPVEGPRRYIDPGAISLGEYLERIAVRAAAGSHEAQAELDRWTRHLKSPSRKRPPTPLEAEQRIEAELEAEQLRFVDPGTNPL